jgi:hypothetical protein
MTVYLIVQKAACWINWILALIPIIIVSYVVIIVTTYTHMYIRF